MAGSITVSMEGTLLNWLKNVGDSVKGGEVIAEIEADKATVEIEAPQDGVLTQQSVQVGESVAEGGVIGTIGAAGEGGASTPQPAAAAASSNGPKISPVSTPAQAKSNGAPQQTPPTQAPAADGDAEADGHLPDGIKASPVARKIAADKGIDLGQVIGSGPSGRIVKEDVEGFQPGKALTPAPSPSGRGEVGTGIAAVPTRKLPEGPDVEIIDVTNLRKRIVAVTVESKQQIPHFYVTTEIDVEPLLNLRKQLNEGLADEAKISVNDLIVKATALTLRQFPNLNTHYYGDKLVKHKRINIGIAVALPKGGLMYVVAHDADKVSLGTLAILNKERIARAREGKVKPDDISGATFSTSNLGPYDVEHFSAIINPPEAGILAVGTALKVPVVKADGTIGVGNRLKITISVDHRVSDGAEGAQYLQAFKNLMENPMRLLI